MTSRRTEVAAMTLSEGVRVVISQSPSGRSIILTIDEADTVQRLLNERTLPAARVLAGEPVPLTGAAAALAAAQLTPEQIEQRKRIGEERAPKRTAALTKWMQRSIEHAAEPCTTCNHARGAHTPDCEECDCERFTDTIDATFEEDEREPYEAPAIVQSASFEPVAVADAPACPICGHAGAVDKPELFVMQATCTGCGWHFTPGLSKP